MNTMHQIYNTIKRIRLEKHFSQAYMADQLAMFQGNYGKLENGKIQITIERLEKIAEVFGMTVLELLAGHEQGTQKKVDVEDYERMVRDLIEDNENLKKLFHLTEKQLSMKTVETNGLTKVVNTFVEYFYDSILKECEEQESREKLLALLGQFILQVGFYNKSFGYELITNNDPYSFTVKVGKISITIGEKNNPLPF